MSREFKSHTRSIELTSKKLEQFAQALEAEKIQSESLLHAYKDSEERVGILLQKNSELSNSLGLSNDRLNTANAKTGELEYALRQMTANAEQKEKDLFDSRNALQNELNQKTALQEREKQLHDEIDKLQEMVEEYYTQLHPQRPTGAANRVKQQANYKIGQYIVKNTKSIGDVFKLPFRVKQIYQTIV
jgi:DNA phosphorothioation-dependent restriction protein DptG